MHEAYWWLLGSGMAFVVISIILWRLIAGINADRDRSTEKPKVEKKMFRKLDLENE